MPTAPRRRSTRWRRTCPRSSPGLRNRALAKRKQTGWPVLLFLLFGTILAYMAKNQVWADAKKKQSLMRPAPLPRGAARMTPQEIKALVRTVPDFPAPGILFRDITTLIAHGQGLSATLDHLADAARDRGGRGDCRARGARLHLRGGGRRAARARLRAAAQGRQAAGPTIGVDYALEYGNARLELDPTLIEDGEQVVLVDDLIATGGTALAGAELLRQAGARVEHALFVIDLPDLGGADALRGDGVEPWSLMAFEGH